MGIPQLGDVVIYTSKIDNGDGKEVRSPAVVLRTRSTSVPEVIDRWGAGPDEVGPSPVDGQAHQTSARPDGVLSGLPDDTTVDLLVHGLGTDYREYNVRLDSDGSLGTWAPRPVSSQSQGYGGGGCIGRCG